MASNTHVEERLQILSALEEWQRKGSNENRDAMLKAATKLDVKRMQQTKGRDPADVAQEVEAKIKSKGIELSSAASSTANPVEHQQVTSNLSELRLRLECMASNTHVEGLLEN